MIESNDKLFIIDGMSLLFRSFYAMGSRLTAPNGTPVGAVYGFLKIIVKILKEQNPTHFAVCWDLKYKTFRHEMYPLYKANRSETPPEILPQIPMIKNLLESMAIPSFAIPGFEADDVAASLANYFQHYGHVYLVTSDKDYMQMINSNISMFSLKKGDEYDVIGREKVIDYFGVPPEQVIEILALTGDSVDNVPGVKGVGDKSAAKLINEFGTLENIYENINKVTNKRVKIALETEKEIAFLSRDLVRIKSDIPLNTSESLLRYNFLQLKNSPTIKAELEALRMTSILKAIFNDTALKETLFNDSFYSQQQNLAIKFTENKTWGECRYQLITKTKDLNSIFERIIDPNLSYFSIDTETTGLDLIEDKPIGFSVSFIENEAYFVPAHPQFCGNSSSLFLLNNPCEFSPSDVWKKLNKALSLRTATLVAHNLKFDLHQFLNVGVHLGDAPIACTMVAAWLCNPIEEGGFSLDALTNKYFNFKKIPTSALIGKETGRKSMLDVPLNELSNYAAEDADATRRLWIIYKQHLEENTELKKLFEDLEMPILRLLARMERNGVHIDLNALEKLKEDFQNRLNVLEKEIFNQVGFAFKISSPKQLGDVLFEHLKIHESIGYKGKLTRTTQGYKTDASVLEQFEEHPVVVHIQQYRELTKLISTYISSLPKLIKQSTGRLHTHFNQIGTSTGRLSSSDPNLQNVPVRTEWGKKVRAAFTSSNNDSYIISADYSQIELRVLAQLSQDENMIAAFKSETDFHRQTAAQIMTKSIEDVSSEERNRAKVINFGIIYGMGAQRLAREQKMSLIEAKKFIDSYFNNFKKVKIYLDTQRAEAHQTGVVKTYFGRRRPIPNIQSKNVMEARFAENMAINSPIQGTAADIMKLAMLAVQKKLDELSCKTKLVLQVHDELVLDGPKSEIELIQNMLKETLEHVVDFLIPMRIEIGYANNWLEVK